MANRFARKAGNWNAADVWSDTPTGVAGAEFIPGPGDVAMANGFIVQVNVDATCAEVRNTATAGGTAGGTFTLTQGVTLTANCYTGTATCVQYTVGAESATIIGNIYGPTTGTSWGVLHGAAGALNIIGSAWSGTGIALAVGTTGTFNFTGNVFAGAGTNIYGLWNSQAGICNVVGNATGGSGASAFGAYNASTGTLTITGNATGGTGLTAYGAHNVSTGTLTVQGLAIGNNYPHEAILNAVPGVHNNNVSGLAYIGGTKSGTGGVQGVWSGRYFFAPGGIQQAYLYDGNQGNLIALNGIDCGLPLESDVRNAVPFGQGLKVGTLAVPPSESVLFGVPVDAGVGSAVMTQEKLAEVFGAIWAQG